MRQYPILAQQALPILVMLARSERTIYYSQLSNYLKMKNHRNLNKVLGEIGSLINNIDKTIPPIQCLVINKKLGLPGSGLSLFIPGYDKMNLKDKILIFENKKKKIFNYKNWDSVLYKLELKPINIDISKIIDNINFSNKHSGGEGKKHKKMKDILSKHPQILNLNSDNIKLKKIEYILRSNDAIDILFRTKESVSIGIEVKSSISDKNDILRGIFQCVKYKALLDAEQILNGGYKNSRTILALESKLPKDLEPIVFILNVEYIDQLLENKLYIRHQ